LDRQLQIAEWLLLSSLYIETQQRKGAYLSWSHYASPLESLIPSVLNPL